eukprot:TRINITY_DN3278_c0_g1_i1.p1 TRINITY_DN3278_c0_g1~~TRINITY_DN3278_c0_g1_i1.p1  ORF type:complete len:492 (+),score=79.16 TRINITY_DN3278_c0_g1_i1:187-1662(+)
MSSPRTLSMGSFSGSEPKLKVRASCDAVPDIVEYFEKLVVRGKGVSLETFVEEVRDENTGFIVKDRKYHLKKYRNCFVGSEAVDWIVNRVDVKRKEAVEIGIHLQRAGVFVHVCDDHVFKDESLFFCFSDRARCVIIGGGFAGSTCAKLLQTSFDVTLIDSKPFFENAVAYPELISRPDHAPSIRIYHNQYLKRGMSIPDRVTAVHHTPERKVVLATGEEVPYDYLIIATGSYYEYGNLFPHDNERVVNALDTRELVMVSQKLHTAHRVAVVGGGSVGIEMAGEVCEGFPNVEVLFFSSREVFLERTVPAAHNLITKHFSKYPNCKILLGEKVRCESGEGDGPLTLTTSSGKTFECDYVFPCIGFKPRTQFLAQNLGTIVDDGGFVKVNEHLQVDGYPDIFAVGDITNVKEEKMAQYAEAQAEVCAKNLIKVLKQRGETLSCYKPADTTTMIVTMGPKSAMLVRGSTVLTKGALASKLKELVNYKIKRGHK